MHPLVEAGSEVEGPGGDAIPRPETIPDMVKSLGEVRRQLSDAEIDLTLHAARCLLQREISELEIRQAGSNAAIIEEYPDDKYSPSCLLLGYTQNGRPLHILVSLADTILVRVITVYEPDQADWVNYTTRR